MPPYQGARAQPDAEQMRRVFAVSKVRLDRHGGIVDHTDGREAIAFDGPEQPGRNLQDITTRAS